MIENQDLKVNQLEQELKDLKAKRHELEKLLIDLENRLNEN
jgi:septal ring factor EnvC (AmiA/AmiB activator)